MQVRVALHLQCFYFIVVGFVAFRFCSSCVRTTEQKEQDIPHVFELLDEDSDSKALFTLACFKGEQFKVGDSVYLPPDAFNFR